MKKKPATEYATIQIDKRIKDIILDHCDDSGKKIGRYIEALVRADYSSSFNISKR